MKNARTRTIPKSAFAKATVALGVALVGATAFGAAAHADTIDDYLGSTFADNPTTVTAEQEAATTLIWTFDDNETVNQNYGWVGGNGLTSASATVTFNAPTGTTFTSDADPVFVWGPISGGLPTDPKGLTSTGILTDCARSNGNTVLTCQTKNPTSENPDITAFISSPGFEYRAYLPAQVDSNAMLGTYSAASPLTYTTNAGTYSITPTLSVDIVQKVGGPIVEPGGAALAGGLVVAAGAVVGAVAFGRRRRTVKG